MKGVGLLYRIGWWLFSTFFRLFHRYRVEGAENVPAEGGVLLVANHASLLDPPLLGCSINRPVHFMAKEELFKIPILKWVLPRVNAFPVRRGGADRSAIRTAIELLEKGKVIGIFPEGTRTRTGELLPLRRGASLVALKANVPVVPVGILGTFRPVRWRGLLPRFNRFVVRIGEPIDLSSLCEGEDERERVERAAAVMMERIAGLLQREG